MDTEGLLRLLKGRQRDEELFYYEVRGGSVYAFCSKKKFDSQRRIEQMSRTIASLAILKTTWEQGKKDYVGNFIPFLATLVLKNRYTSIDNTDINKISDDFKDEFGLVIPYHPMRTILGRANKIGLLTKSMGRFTPVREKLIELDFSEKRKDEERKFEKVLNEFIWFCKNNFKKEMTLEEAESAFISFLKMHDVDILFAAHGRSVLPEVKRAKEHKFLISSFLKYIQQSEPSTHTYIVDIAIGHILSCAILYNESDQYQGKLEGTSFYLDTGLIFKILGIGEKEYIDANIELLKSLTEVRARLLIFSHVYDEVIGILEGCRNWVENPQCDLTIAGRTLIYFIQNDYTKYDVERFIANVKKN